MNTLPYKNTELIRVSVGFSYLYLIYGILIGIIGLWENVQIGKVLSGELSYSEVTRVIDLIDLIVVKSAILFVIIAVITFIINAVWLYRASKNASIILPSTERITPGWTLGWFIVPIANIWKPYVAIKQIWNTSFSQSDDIDTPTPAFFSLWWTAWLAGTVFSRIVSRIQMSSDDIELYMTLNYVWVPIAITMAISAYCFIKIMREVTNAQISWHGDQSLKTTAEN